MFDIMISDGSWFNKCDIWPVNRNDCSSIGTITGFTKSTCNKWYQRGNISLLSVSLVLFSVLNNNVRRNYNDVLRTSHYLKYRHHKNKFYF